MDDDDIEEVPWPNIGDYVIRALAFILSPLAGRSALRDASGIKMLKAVAREPQPVTEVSRKMSSLPLLGMVTVIFLTCYAIQVAWSSFQMNLGPHHWYVVAESRSTKFAAPRATVAGPYQSKRECQDHNRLPIGDRGDSFRLCEELKDDEASNIASYRR